MTAEERRERKKRRFYPKCREHPNGKHRFGIPNLSFRDAVMHRHKDLDHICKCGFSRKEWKARP